MENDPHLIYTSEISKPHIIPRFSEPKSWSTMLSPSKDPGCAAIQQSMLTENSWTLSWYPKRNIF